MLFQFDDYVAYLIFIIQKYFFFELCTLLYEDTELKQGKLELICLF